MLHTLFSRYCVWLSKLCLLINSQLNRVKCDSYQWSFVFDTHIRAIILSHHKCWTMIRRKSVTLTPFPFIKVSMTRWFISNVFLGWRRGAGKTSKKVTTQFFLINCVSISLWEVFWSCWGWISGKYKTIAIQFAHSLHCYLDHQSRNIFKVTISMENM